MCVNSPTNWMLNVSDQWGLEGGGEREWTMQKYLRMHGLHSFIAAAVSASAVESPCSRMYNILIQLNFCWALFKI